MAAVDFATRDDALSTALSHVAAEIGTPCYVYFLDRIVERIERIRHAFESRFLLSYAIKANPNRALLRALEPHIALLDASSAGELVGGPSCGYDVSRISFSGPAKTQDELQTAVKLGCPKVVVESFEEARQLNDLCRQQAVMLPILIRISPLKIPRGFGVNMAGRPSQFGIDEEDLGRVVPRIQQLPYLTIQGLHIYAGTQCLDDDSLVENFGNYIDLFGRVSNDYGLEPEWLLFGAGIGIPYHDGDEPVDLESVAHRVNPMVDRMRQSASLERAKCVLELGRYLVGEAGYFLTRILRRKQSRGRNLCVCDGGMNHHLAACGHFGSVIHRNYPMFKVETDGAPDHADRETYDVFGPLCTSIDIPARNITLPPLEAGDVIAIGSSGAYGLTASPLYFISHPKPREVMISGSGEAIGIEDVTHEGTPQLVLRN